MTRYEAGAWLAICDRCGLERKSHQLRQEWTGLRVCSECWEPRHPQETLRGREDRQAPPWVRPEVDGPAVGGIGASSSEGASSGVYSASSGGSIVTPDDL